MPPAAIVALVSLAVIVLAAVLVGVHMQRRRRLRAWVALAPRLGLRFVRHGAWVLSRFPAWAPDRADARNVLVGTIDAHRVFVFDYYPEGYAGGMDDGEHPARGCVLLELTRELPSLRIRPSGLRSRLHQPIGTPVIRFDSVEFSSAFLVTSEDRKFAYDVCHPRMMQYLLRHRRLSLDVRGNAIALIFPCPLPPGRVASRIRQLIEIRELLPDYLFRN